MLTAASAATQPEIAAPDRSAGGPAKLELWELDLRSGELTLSAALRRSLGLDPHAMLTWDALAASVHTQDRAQQRGAVAQAIATGTDYDAEWRVLPARGGPRWWHVRAQVSHLVDGAPVRIAGVFFDVTERRAAELDAELREESMRLAAEAAEVGLWDLDLSNDVLTWSDRTKAMFGISPQVHCTMADFYAGLHPDDRAATTAAFASAIDPALRATYDAEYRTIGREDGVTRWVAAKGRGLFTGDRCHRAIGTAIDITERKLAAIRQTFLLDLMDRLRRLSDPAAILQSAAAALGAHLGACRVGYGQMQDDDTTVVLETCYVNGVEPLHGSLKLEQFGPRQIALQRQGRTVAVDDVQADPDQDTAFRMAIDTRAFVAVPLIRDGRLRANLFVNHRAPRAWSRADIALIEDVAARTWEAHELARAEAALRALNAALEQQVESRTRALDRVWRLSPVLMVVGGPDGTLLQANPAWTRLLGWSAAQTIGHDVMEFVAPEDRETGAAGMEQLFQGQPVIEYQNTFITSGGERRRIAWTTVPEDGKLYGFGRDITEQMLVEQRLRQAQKMEAVGQLTGGIAHDFNNLLTGISGSLELLQARIAQGRAQDVGRYIDLAQGSARRAAALTQRLLAFSRQQTLNARPTDVNLLVGGMEELIRRTVGPELDVVVTAAPGLWTTLVDPHQLENALLNLCINARDAMPDGGRLHIATANHKLDAAAAQRRELPPGPYVALAVSDTGTGMTPEVRQRAFDPFFTTKPSGAGTGLGLSMIYGFARQSGGQTSIDTALGDGTTVTIYLPRHHGARAAAVGESPTPAAAATSGGTVLVVDDELAVRLLVTEVLEEHGYRTLQAGDAAGGLELLRMAATVDLLVTDVGLSGGQNGRQFAKAARRERPELPVLFITGYAEKAVLDHERLEAGMRILAKPFTIDVLVDHVRRMLGDSPDGGPQATAGSSREAD